MQSPKYYFSFAAISFLLLFSSPLRSQGYIESKDKSCKIYTSSNVEKRSFTYIGSCVGGYVSGKATVTLLQDGSFYWVATGNFDKGVLNGKGTQSFYNGHKFEGTFINGNRSNGTYTFDDGRVYVGGFDEKGKFSGKGTYTWANGQKYEGEFENDKYHGYGIFYYTSGNRYDGLWEAGARHGKAKYYFANGDRFEGVFSNGSCPAGIMYYKNGTTANGSFAYNEFTPDAKTPAPERPITFTSSEEAEAYLDKNYFASTSKIENGYWVDPYMLFFNEEDFLAIMRCEGKTLEKYFVEENEAELEKTLTVLEEDPYLIYWHEIKSITVAKDGAGEYWLTIKAPIMTQYDELILNEIKLYVKEESRENVKNALLYLQKNPVKKKKTDEEIEREKRLKELEKEREEAKKLYDEVQGIRVVMKKESENYFSSRQSALKYLQDNFPTSVYETSTTIKYTEYYFSYYFETNLVNTYYFKECSYADFTGQNLTVYGEVTQNSRSSYRHHSFKCEMSKGKDAVKIRAAFNYLIQH